MNEPRQATADNSRDLRMYQNILGWIRPLDPDKIVQIEPTWVPTDAKVALIDQLSSAGFTRIEAGSFVSPKAIPALRDGEEVFSRIRRQPGVVYVALIPNRRGAQRALQAGADELNLVMSASQTHNRANMRMRCEDSLAAFADIVRLTAGTTVTLNGLDVNSRLVPGQKVKLVVFGARRA